MNLRNCENYNIGLDIGTGSVGWAVTDVDGNLCRFKTKPTWGSRVFNGAETAANARTYRGQRRRYSRRRQRINLLQELFAPEIEKIDGDFFIRMNQARLLKEDRLDGCSNYVWPFFNDSDFTEKDYYQQFPTIYHLRAWLMETQEKADIRLIYLAFHNIVKARGNFLHQDSPKLSAKNANIGESVEEFCAELEVWLLLHDIENNCSEKAQSIEKILSDTSLKKAAKKDALVNEFSFPSEYKKMAQALAGALIGYKVELAEIFFVEPEESKISLANDEGVEAFSAICPDEGFALFEAMQKIYSSLVLIDILKSAPGQTISYCKIAEYEKYGEDLRQLKQIIKENRRFYENVDSAQCGNQDVNTQSDLYEEFFRGELRDDGKDYSSSKAKYYTKFNLKRGAADQEAFYKEVLKILADIYGAESEVYQSIAAEIEEGTYLRRLKTGENGSIPYQLHLEEMLAIIDNQAKYYPFLKEDQAKLTSLITFRIPYYVGPLTQKNARKDKQGNNRFAWSERQEGMESEKIYPWNWEQIIDKDKSAENFMNRMIGTCTYLQGEQVLPRCSLTYELFCVANELAGAKWSSDGDAFHRFSASTRLGLIEDLFKKQKSVSHKNVRDWLTQHGHFGHIQISGTQAESKFESKLGSYNDFCKWLGVDELSAEEMAMAEEIILWNTLFEDRDILKRKIKAKYAQKFSDKTISSICRKRYTGWGRLSRKLLNGLELKTDSGNKTVMDILLEGDQNHDGHIGASMTFMEILHDETLGLQELINAKNTQYLENTEGFCLDDLPGSPALRRSLNQTLRVVDEITSIAGHAPSNVFVEVTREDSLKKKGVRTTTRYNTVKSAVEALKKEDPDLWNELKRVDPKKFDERLELYFVQRGKCLYSGEYLDINRLSDYQIDHIIPQSYIKDDSIDNKALVLPSKNQRKTDSLLLDDSIRRKMAHYWGSLNDAGLISDKKYNNLMRSHFNEKQLKGFIARQLVETSQIIKTLQTILQKKYPETRISPVKASLSSGLRHVCHFVKCRELNDFHHAHDAYLAEEMGRFIQQRHAKYYDNPIAFTHAMKAFVRSQGEEYAKTGRMPGSAEFFVASFLHSGADEETGEIWDAQDAIARIRRCLDYKDCYISRMPEETSGAFWDATIYSPHEPGKTLALPLKKGLDPQKYGSYSSEKFAYFFVFDAYNKKGKQVACFEPVPVRVASSIAQAPNALEEYARSVSEANNLTFNSILRKKVLKYQKIAVDGNQLYITGKREVRNGSQFAFTQSETKLLMQLFDGDELKPEERETLVSTIWTKYQKYAPRLYAQMSLEEKQSIAVNLEKDELAQVIASLIAIANAKTNMIDLRAIGGSKASGCVKLNYGKLLVDRGILFEFIDSSVTGMFERRTLVEL